MNVDRTIFLLSLAAAFVAVLIGSLLTFGAVRSTSRSPSVPASFIPVDVEDTPVPTATGAPTGIGAPLSSPDSSGTPGATARPTADPSAVHLRATWYCNADPRRGRLSRCTRGHPDGPADDLYAAISPDLARLRGRTVTVCSGDRCVEGVRIIDCDCRARRSIDLYADVFMRLGPLSRGVLAVEVLR